MTTDRFILRIDPPQPCRGHYPNEEGEEGPCTLLTNLAEAEHEGQCERQLRVSPYCHRHLYLGWPDPTPEELETEHWCVTNFVINELGEGLGTAEVLGTFPTDSIPPPYEQWDPTEAMDDDAWYVTYQGEDGHEQRGIVIYLVWENWFVWQPR